MSAQQVMSALGQKQTCAMQKEGRLAAASPKFIFVF